MKRVRVARIAAALGFYIKRGDAQSLGDDGSFHLPVASVTTISPRA
jgi:capsid protein